MPIFNIGAGKPFCVPMLNADLPANATVTYLSGESKSATFSVGIDEAGHPDKYTYQWYVDGKAVSGATGSSYTKAGLTAGAYSVCCKVTNAAGTVTSRTATLTVTLYKTPVLNGSYPADQSTTYVSGESKSARFEAKISTAGVPASYSYQWYVNGEAVSGATDSSYTKTNLTAGTYSVCCKVTNAAGTVTSRTATLTVTLYKTPVLNGSYPANQTVTYVSGESKSAKFEAKISTAGVPANYTYQWYVNGEAVSGATGSSYTKSGLTAGTYTVYCKVTNDAGTVQTRTATLTVTLYKTPVLNTSYPANQTVTYVSGESKSAKFEAKISTAGVPASYTYQWYVNGEAVSGATGSSYTKSGLTAGTYTVYCKVTNDAGTVQTRTATLTVTLYKTPVLNTSYPANVTQVEKASGSATFKVTIATAGVPASYTYQWYVDGTAVSGATKASYTKTDLTATGSYKIYCKVTNAAGSVNSRTATLTVQSSQPTFEYDGTYELVKEYSYSWKLKLKTSGVLKFTHFGTGAGKVDVFLVGGGGGGQDYQYGQAGGAGGGGGYTTTATEESLELNKEYTITIGAGGAAKQTSVGGNGGKTSAFGLSAAGGKGGGNGKTNRYYGGDGGSGGGAGGAGPEGTGGSGKGGSDGGNGGNGTNGSDGSTCGTGGTGQGTTTREFGSTSGTIYAGGGAGAKVYYVNSQSGGSGGGGKVTSGVGSDGTANTGGGGGGGGIANVDAIQAGDGGCGIVIVRNHR